MGLISRSVMCGAVLLSGLGAYGQGPHELTAGETTQIDALIAKMTVAEKLAYIGGTGFAVRAVPSVGLPAFEMSDGPFGVRSNAGFPSTTYAAGINLAATWDRGMAAMVGGGIGRDARVRGVHYMLGPGTNIYKSPLNGRNFEYFGEDPYLAGEMVTAYVTGMQSTGVSATVKHYVANNSEYLRHDSDSVVDERALREIYLPAFEAAVKRGHVGAVMDSYNLINGVHATQNGYLNTEILRTEWGFQGTLMSDWVATYDGVAAANGGLDLEMPTGKFMNEAVLGPALQAGTVTQATIDAKVRHVLTTAMMFGWLTRPQADASGGYLNMKSDRVALRAAEEGTVLLKNDGGLLPLDKSKVKTMLVVGPDAYPAVAVGGGSAGVVPFHGVSPLEGISNVAGTGVTVMYDRGVPTLPALQRATKLTTAAGGGQEGATEEIFEGGELAGPSLRTMVVRTVTLDGSSFKLLIENLDNAMTTLMAAKDHPLSHRFTTYYQAAGGRVALALEGAGEGNGNRVYVDGNLVIDNWKLLRAFQPQVTLDLPAGSHKVVVEEWQRGTVGGHLQFAMVPATEMVNAAAVEMAKKADVVVVEAGFAQASEGEAGDRPFGLPYGQDELIAAVEAVNPKTIVVVTSGGNVDSRAWLARTPALLEAWYGGQAGGQAQGEILFGNVNPSGHLPVSFERAPEDSPSFASYYPVGDSKRVEYKDGIFVGYRGYEQNHVQPLFPFGFGMSYTTFAFRNLKVAKGSGDAVATVDFDVVNTGARAGATVAQVYVSDGHAKVARPAHELKNFERVELAAGASQHVSLNLDARAFAYYDVSSKGWVVAPGRFTVSVGDSVASLPLTETVEVGKVTAGLAR